MNGLPVEVTSVGDLLVTGGIVLLFVLGLVSSLLPRLLRH